MIIRDCVQWPMHLLTSNVLPAFATHPEYLFQAYPLFEQISAQRLGKWIRTILKMVGVDIHTPRIQSTRSVVSSALINRNVPIDTILAHCKWTSPSAF